MLTILPSFDKVVQIEAKDFSEGLFESIRQKIQADCTPELMPFDERILSDMRLETIKFANTCLNDKLG